MATILKPSEKNVYNWLNRKVVDFAKAIAPEPSETKAVVNVTPPAVDSFGVSNVVLTTTANKTIFNLGAVNGNNISYMEITLGNPGQQAVGDTLILMFNAINSSVTATFNTTYFYHQTTGGPNPALPSLSATERSVTILTFDGEKFTCTADNG